MFPSVRCTAAVRWDGLPANNPQIPPWQAWIETSRAANFDAYLHFRNNRGVTEVALKENMSPRQAYHRI